MIDTEYFSSTLRKWPCQLMQLAKLHFIIDISAYLYYFTDKYICSRANCKPYFITRTSLGT